MRLSERNFSVEDVTFVVDHGKREYRNGAVHYWMQDRKIPDELRADNKYRRLGNTRVILCVCQQLVITMYRDTRKEKYHDYCPDGPRNIGCYCCNRSVAA